MIDYSTQIAELQAQHRAAKKAAHVAAVAERTAARQEAVRLNRIVRNDLKVVTQTNRASELAFRKQKTIARYEAIVECKALLKSVRVTKDEFAELFA